MTFDKSQKRTSYLARFGYIGSGFHGLQPNKGFRTAGGALYEVLEEASGLRPRALQFSARTDAGVHALENYATFWFPKPFDHEAFLSKVSSASLQGLMYLSVEQVHYKVHARANAKGKWYRYVIEDQVGTCDEEAPFTWQVVPGLDATKMQEAANHLVGTFEFDAFQHGKCESSNTRKSVKAIKVTRCQLVSGKQQIHIDVEGGGFLRRMVRIIVGTLAEVGAGFREPEAIKDILASRQRRKAGLCAPAAGLTLMRIGMTT